MGNESKWRYAGPGDFKTGYGLFRDEEIAADEIVRARTNKQEKLIILIHTDILKKFDYKTAKIEKLILDPSEIGVNPNYFGGQCKKAAILKDSPYILLLNRANQVIGLYVPKDVSTLNRFNITELLSITKRQGLKATTRNSKDELINMLTNIK